jgi:beta-lactamase regulating signal transducer with metallopeptidase domain
MSRATLLTIVLASFVIPAVHLPAQEHPIILKVSPGFLEDDVNKVPEQSNQVPLVSASGSDTHTVILPLRTVLIFIYIAGAFISLLYFIYSVISVSRLFKNARPHRVNGTDLLVTHRDIPAFSFIRSILISENDLEHADSIVTHELSHIRLGHCYDLMMMELAKIIYWFNPLVYKINRDLKEIHEFQADDDTLESGVDAARYQLLIIQKCVGHQSFALANSFNHCQIKKRIIMMNKSKTSKAWRWKVATFLPVLALLLMAFSRRNEIAIPAVNLPSQVTAPDVPVQNKYDQFKRRIAIKKDANYIDNKQVSLDEIAEKGKEWYKTGNDGIAGNDWILLLVDESIPLNRIDEVRGALKHDYWIVQTTVNSNDLVYFAGDVSDMAKFTQGSWNAWITDQLKKFPEAFSEKDNYDISYSFIIDKNGKVRDGHIIKASDYPEINAAYEKILNQIPDWEPAKRLGAKVSVYNRHTFGLRNMKK